MNNFDGLRINYSFEWICSSKNIDKSIVMIQGFPTKKGTGIEIMGDYIDLKNLYETVHKIGDKLDDYENKFKGQSQILNSFAYEIRHAFQKDRLYQKVVDSHQDDVYYFGFQYLWTDLLFTISVLRYNAGYVPLDELDQANLYLIEHITKKALFAFDPQGAHDIQNFIGCRIDVSDPLIFLINGALDIDYLKEKPTIKRFRNIPNLIINYSSQSEKYKICKQNLEISAKKLNCDILEIEYDNIPEIIW